MKFKEKHNKLKLNIPMYNSSYGGGNNNLNLLSTSHQKMSNTPIMPIIQKNYQNKLARPLSISKNQYSPLSLDTPIISNHVAVNYSAKKQSRVGLFNQEKEKDKVYSLSYYNNHHKKENKLKETPIKSLKDKEINEIHEIKESKLQELKKERENREMKKKQEKEKEKNEKHDFNYSNYTMGSGFSGMKENSLSKSTSQKISSQNHNNQNHLTSFSAINNDLKNRINKLNPLSTSSATTYGKFNKENIFNKEIEVSSKTPTNNSISSNNNNNSMNQQFNKTHQVPSTTKNQPINIMSLFASNLPLDVKHLNNNYLYYDASKYSAKSLGVVKSYSANTHQGTVRDYNEDRVSIILNIVKPSTYTGTFWPKCSFFGVYDGHGGPGCSEYLRDNLHQFVIRDGNFPVNPKEAIIQGFKAAEKEFITKYALNLNGTEIVDRSGSCASVVLVVDDIVYIANAGDSRVVLSKNHGKDVIPLSKDHKPDDPDETKRIIEAGGRIYQ